MKGEGDLQCILDAASRDTRLNYTDFKVLRLLVSRYYNRETGVCIPSNRTIAAWMENDVRSVQRSMKRLEENGYIKRESRFMAMGGQTSNHISFMEISKNDNENDTGEDDNLFNIINNLSRGGGQKDCDVNQNVTHPPGQNYYPVNNNVIPPLTTVVTPSNNLLTLININGIQSYPHSSYPHDAAKSFQKLLPVVIEKFARQGVNEVRARRIIGKFVKIYGSIAVLRAFLALLSNNPRDAVAYLRGILERSGLPAEMEIEIDQDTQEGVITWPPEPPPEPSETKEGSHIARTADEESALLRMLEEMKEELGMNQKQARRWV